jgi:hypothetical protein
MQRARKLEENLAKVRAEQEPLRKKNLTLIKEIGNLKERMGGFEKELASSVISRRRCVSPVPPDGMEDMEVDVVEFGEWRRNQRRPSEEDLQPAGGLLIASNLMGINEAVRGILCRLEVLESRSRRDPFLAPQPRVPPPSEEPEVKGEKKEKRVSGRKGGRIIPADTEKKRRTRRKKAVPSTIAAEEHAPLKDGPEFTGDVVQDNEPAGSLVSESASAPVPWTKVVGRGKAKGGKGSRTGESATPQTPKGPPLPPPGKGPGKGMNPLKAIKRRVKRTAAVMVTAPSNNYAKAMALAREKINLEEFGIAGLNFRRAFSGGMVLEIPGERADAQASYLATSLRMVFGGVEELKDVRVAVPTQSSSLRLHGVEDSITDEEVKTCVAEAGGCSPREVHLGKWFALQGRLRNVVVQCPSRAAIRITKAGARVKIGWSFVRAVLLKKSILTCYRCLMRGHTQQRCPSDKNFSRCCKNCGKEGHKAADCKAPAHCPVCAGKRRRDFKHRMGSEACPPMQPRMVPASLGSGRKGASLPVGGSPPPSTPGVTLEPKGRRESPSFPDVGSPSLSNLGPLGTSSGPAKSLDFVVDKGKSGVAVSLGMVSACEAKNRADSDGSASAKGTGVEAKGPRSGGSSGPRIVSDEPISVVAMDIDSWGASYKKRGKSDSGEE